MYKTKEIADGFSTTVNKIIKLRNKKLISGEDYYFHSGFTMYRESAIEFFKIHFNISNPKFIEHNMDKLSVMRNLKEKKAVSEPFNYGLTPERKKSLVARLKELPDGSYMKSELKEWCKHAIPPITFHRYFDDYCKKTYNPVVTKRGENFYDKNVECQIKGIEIIEKDE